MIEQAQHRRLLYAYKNALFNVVDLPNRFSEERALRIVPLGSGGIFLVVGPVKRIDDVL